MNKQKRLDQLLFPLFRLCGSGQNESVMTIEPAATTVTI
jgi:hypothetical protein